MSLHVQSPVSFDLTSRWAPIDGFEGQQGQRNNFSLGHRQIFEKSVYLEVTNNHRPLAQW